MNDSKINLAIFASGSGTNAENIAKYFTKHSQIQISKILSNKKNASVLKRAEKLGIPSSIFSKQDFQKPSFLNHLSGIDYIILAGFLWLIPKYLIEAFLGKIINIHPALLPKYGGKGMYGHYVHEAVIKSGETESGITIHLVNEKYDEGEILFQAICEISDKDSSDDLAKKIHELEYQHFPRVIEDHVLKR